MVRINILYPNLEERAVDIRAAQQRIMENKASKGFNVSDVPLGLCLLNGEVAEVFDAWRKRRADLGEELADVAIYVLSLAAMLGVDLEAEMESKIEKNAHRRYERQQNGTLIRVAEGESTRLRGGSMGAGV
jgi:NTP pyrophosphatase (non-canonical NTP hydrolase)